MFIFETKSNRFLTTKLDIPQPNWRFYVYVVLMLVYDECFSINNAFLEFGQEKSWKQKSSKSGKLFHLPKK